MQPEWLPKTIKTAIEYYRQVHSQDCSAEVLQEAKRMLCRGDLFYLLVYVLGRKDMLHPWLFDRCREVQDEPNGYLDLWGRYHYKSTIITFGLTIQDIINDPEITIGIFSHTGSIAKDFLKQIKRELEANEQLKSLFPEILWERPERQSLKWSENEGLIVKRKSNPKEATVEASGLTDGQPTGKHFKLRIYDDVVTLESVATSAQIAKTTEAWGMSDNLGMEGGIVRTIGTRYSLHDTYAEMMSRGVVRTRVYPATHNRRFDGIPVLLSPPYWEERKKVQTRSQIASQFLQNPLADEDATFRPEWLKPYEVRPRTMNVYICCDPSRGRSATSDNTAIAVIGVSSTGVRYLLDGYCHRMPLSKRWSYLRDIYRRWSSEPGVQQVKVGYERYGAQSDDEYFQERMEREDFYFTIEELNWPREGGNSKKDRVERLEPDFRNGRFLLPLAVWREGKPCVWSVDTNPDSSTFQTVQWRDLEGFTRNQREAIEAGSPELVAKAIKRMDEEKQTYDLTAHFIEEFMTFPFGQFKDMVDATSRIYDLEVRPPVLISQHATEPNVYFDS